VTIKYNDQIKATRMTVGPVINQKEKFAATHFDAEVPPTQIVLDAAGLLLGCIVSTEIRQISRPITK